MSTCSSCQHPNGPQANFCGKCGARLVATAPAAPQEDPATFLGGAPPAAAREAHVPQAPVVAEDPATYLGDRTRPPAMAVVPTAPRPVPAPAQSAPATPTPEPAHLVRVAGRPPEATLIQGAQPALVHVASGRSFPLRAGPCVVCIGTHVAEALGDVDMWALTGNAALSRRHAMLLVDENGGVRVMDAGSKNGTFVAGRRLPPLEPQPIAVGEVLALGQGGLAEFEFRR